MALIVVTSTAAGEGKTGVAVAIARHYAYLGVPVRLARAASGGGGGDEDAGFFGGLEFAPGTATEPAEAGSITDPGGDALLVVEVDLEAAKALGGRVVLVSRGAPPAELPDGVTPAAIVTVAASRSWLESGPSSVSDVPVVVLEEDRTLAGFSVSEARALLHAEVLVEGDGADPTCDYLVVAPIGSDAGQPYFRRFETKAVVVRFDKTDMHLAAIRAEPQCLILTGGRYPSDYVYDAARANQLPVLLSRTDTENTVIALEGLWDSTRFQGERKLDRMATLLEATALFAVLDRGS